VRAELRALTIRTSHSARGAQRTARPTFFAIGALRVSRYAPRMDLPVRKKLPHTIPQWVAEGSWFFITINCVPPGKNQLCRAEAGDAVLAAMKFNHERFVWHCRLCPLMPDHLHAIIAFPREPGMQTTVRNWKKFVAGKHGVDWQRDFFEHRLRDHHELEEKTSYVLMNPVRKGLCEPAEDWVWVYRPNDRSPPLLG
jgi:REP-associated tyrosine transposase